MSSEDSLAAEVDAWFEARGFRLRISDVDYSTELRVSRWGRGAPSRDLHAWVDLLTLDGRLAQLGYGSGTSPIDAKVRARERYREEQGE